MRVSLDDLREDMVLAADILDGGGRMLLPTGTVLTEKHIRYCQMWGIPEAEIQGDEPVENEESILDPALLARADAEVRPRFRHNDLEHPLVAALFRYCVRVAALRPR